MLQGCSCQPEGRRCPEFPMSPVPVLGAGQTACPCDINSDDHIASVHTCCIATWCSNAAVSPILAARSRLACLSAWAAVMHNALVTRGCCAVSFNVNVSHFGCPLGTAPDSYNTRVASYVDVQLQCRRLLGCAFQRTSAGAARTAQIQRSPRE
jgi:hypothetical protein